MGISLSGISGASGILPPPPPPSGGFDSDAQAFITAAGITNSTQQNAINNLVLGFKSNGTWSKYAAIYPLVGGTAFSHGFNLRDPRDLNAAFRVAWSGSITHSANGVTGGGGFGNTFYTGTSNGLGFYVVGISSIGDVGMGADITGGWRNTIDPRWTNGNTAWDGYSGSVGNGRFSANLSGTNLGLLHYSINYATRLLIAARNADILSSSVQGGTPGSNTSGLAYYLLASNVGGTAIFNSARQYRFFFIRSQVLNAAEMIADYNTIQAYQAALGRQV